ncbi:DUF6452 family protein [Seonamhaeicola maritimus]|uniref:Uncharacterized protein n=1 Tax=Seonamhaeicola maritimus TaxID=2591822 RepID=A0A5C7GMD2_9FLAO|nr:DUF6452 family protein [Seonamhaeicola maritimus]TXG39420.1 hypothetical protein FUA22_05980 [Seonamhaeicola maritimus]
MKYIRLIIIPIIAVVIGFTISCERDDICPESTPTTPRLIIDLYDNDNQENQKNVFNLVVIGIDNDFILSGYEFTTADDLVLPLKTDANTTRYRLVKDASINDNGTPNDPDDDFIEGNIDIITINYSREDVYVSRACGYKTIFDNITLNIEADGDNWLLSTQDLTDNEPITNEDATHFNMFH